MLIPSPFAVLHAFLRRFRKTRLAVVDPRLADGKILRVSGNDEGVLRAAYEAHKALPVFLEHLANPPPGTSGFAVKTRLMKDGSREFVWIDGLVMRDGVLHGRLASEPRYVQDYRKGQPMTVAPRDVFDWVYFEDGVRKGNYTVAALETASQAQKADGRPDVDARAS